MAKILIACEESQRICSEFRRLGHEAIHSVIRTLANFNFAIYIFGGLIGIDYKTWIDVAMAGNIIIMLIMAGMED